MLNILNIIESSSLISLEPTRILQWQVLASVSYS